MKLLRDRLDRAARAAGVPLDVIQKDYALSHVLVGLASQPDLSKGLVLKGGTALKKYFFGDYRFSEDLDFSTRDARAARSWSPRSGRPWTWRPRACRDTARSRWR